MFWDKLLKSFGKLGLLIWNIDVLDALCLRKVWNQNVKDSNEAIDGKDLESLIVCWLESNNFHHVVDHPLRPDIHKPKVLEAGRKECWQYLLLLNKLLITRFESTYNRFTRYFFTSRLSRITDLGMNQIVHQIRLIWNGLKSILLNCYRMTLRTNRTCGSFLSSE